MRRVQKARAQGHRKGDARAKASDISTRRGFFGVAPGIFRREVLVRDHHRKKAAAGPGGGMALFVNGGRRRPCGLPARSPSSARHGGCEGVTNDGVAERGRVRVRPTVFWWGSRLRCAGRECRERLFELHFWSPKKNGRLVAVPRNPKKLLSWLPFLEFPSKSPKNKCHVTFFRTHFGPRKKGDMALIFLRRK